MRNLLTCSRADFVSEVEQIFDIDEIRKILSELEKEKNKIKHEKEKNGKITAREALKSDEGQKLIRDISALSEIENKIRFCNSYLLKMQIDANNFNDKSVKRSILQKLILQSSVNSFSWGIVQKDEPEKVFETTFDYIKNNRNLKGKLEVVNCAEFLWKDEPGLDLEKIQDDFEKTNLDVPVKSRDNNSVTYNMNDICDAVEELESHRGKLDLIHVILTHDIQDEEGKQINYLMLMSLNRDLDWNDKEVQKLFINTYLSKTVKKIIDDPNEESRYFGEIIRNPSGKLEISFDNDKAVMAVAKANKTYGTLKERTRVSKNELTDMILTMRVQMGQHMNFQKIQDEIKNIEKPTNESDGR